MKTKTLLILAGLLLMSLACTLEDLGAAGSALRAAALGMEASPTATVGLPTPALVPAAIARAKPTEIPVTHTVCTGVPTGQLRVRQQAGTESPVVAVLDEGKEVTVLDEVQQAYKGTWSLLAEPAGWVNARYLCAKN